MRPDPSELGPTHVVIELPALSAAEALAVIDVCERLSAQLGPITATLSALRSFKIAGAAPPPIRSNGRSNLQALDPMRSARR